MANKECCYDCFRDFSALRERIAVKFPTEKMFAESINMNKHQLSNRFRCKVPFHAKEIMAICKALEIPFTETERYFRTPLIEKDGPIGIRAVIKQMYGSEAAFSKELGLSKHMLSTRLNFETDFRYSELRRMAELLDLNITDIDALIQVERRILDEQKS
jgi:hypothetical protein